MDLNDASAALSVRLFGELELRLGDQRLPRLESARARSLLAFLLLHRDAPQSRHRLAFMLWPDSNECQALDFFDPANIGQIMSTAGALAGQI